MKWCLLLLVIVYFGCIPSLFLNWLQVSALTLKILQPGSCILLHTTGSITFHKLSHGLLGIISVLHVIQYHKPRTQPVEQVTLEEEPVQLIQLSVAVTDPCREQKEINGIWGHYILQLKSMQFLKRRLWSFHMPVFKIILHQWVLIMKPRFLGLLGKNT